MRIVDRVLVALTTLLLLVAVVLCWYPTTAPQSFSFEGNTPPLQFMLVQIAGSLAGPFALVGLASAAGLLFLRAARWTPEIVDDGPTTAPSP
jgi:type IV secretory pathway VirB2 component (pilin)